VKDHSQRRTSVIVAGARTPMGRLLGGLRDFSAPELGAIAIRAAVQRSRIEPAAVDYVIMGQVLQAGVGQGPARIAAAKAGIPMSVPAITVNKLCLSGLNAVATADALIRAGEVEVVVAGGMESMTRAPHLLLGSRVGVKYGDTVMKDHMDIDGLYDAWTDQAMGALTEAANVDDRRFARQEMDEFAVASHRRAALAAKNGLFDDEITPVSVPQRKGDPLILTADEGVRPDTSLEQLGRLRPAFRSDGTITAGSSSPISDGAAAMVVMSKQRAQAEGLSWIAEIGAHGQVAGPDSTLQSQPARAIRAALARADLQVGDLDLVEINEAFAAVALTSIRELGLDPARVNVNGGAIATGHPVGMSGARLVLHLALELGRRGGGTGAAALCGGGGQGDALLLHVAPVD